MVRWKIPDKAKVTEKWRNVALGHSRRCRSERSEGIKLCVVFNISDLAQNERKGEITCTEPMPQVKTKPRLSQKGWHRVRPRMGCSKASQLVLSPRTHGPCWRISHGPNPEDLFPTWHYYLLWLELKQRPQNPARTGCLLCWALCKHRQPAQSLGPKKCRLKFRPAALRMQLQHRWRQ